MNSNKFETHAAGAEVFKHWESLQHQWWRALAEGSKSFSPTAAPVLSDPLQGFGNLFGDYSGNGANTASVARFLAANKQFLAWLQGFSAQASALGDLPGKVEDWAALFKQLAGPMLESKNPLLNLFQSMNGDSAVGFGRGFSALQNPAEMFTGEAKKLLAMPAFGYSREQQERTQEFSTATLEWQEAVAAYNALMLQASQQGFERMQSKLAEREEPGRQLDSLRAIYDLWIDAAEEAYAEIALSEKFQSVYGNLVNKQMAVQQLLNTEVEHATEKVGMPTRRELNSVHQRLQDMRRHINELENRLEATNGNAPAAKSEVNASEIKNRSKAKSKPEMAKKSAVKQTAAIQLNKKPSATKTAVKKGITGQSRNTKSIAAKHALARFA